MVLCDVCNRPRHFTFPLQLSYVVNAILCIQSASTSAHTLKRSLDLVSKSHGVEVPTALLLVATLVSAL